MRLKRTIFFLVLLLPCFIINKAWATHERAGYIIWQHIYAKNKPYTYQFTVVTFTKESSYLADRKNLTVFWGDGTSDSIPRTDTLLYPNNEDIKRNTYIGTHSYSAGLGFPYQISMTDPNRISGIINIETGNSVNVQLCVFDTMVIEDPAIFGYDNSPVILNPPIQFGSVGQTFYYNPDAYDPDGDSLSYSLTPPKEQPDIQPPGQEVPGYQYPDQIDPSSKNQESLDPVTGLFTWNAPQAKGTYNVDMYVYEYRKIHGIYLMIGCVDVDIEIIINATYDHPPKIYSVKDTCILAGQTLIDTIRSSDSDTGQFVTLVAAGSPFKVADTATFSSKVIGIDTTVGYFKWATGCDDIRYQTYQVVFTANDDYQPPLYDQITWNITVVAPPPDSLKASATGNSITLSWPSPYHCASASTFLGFTVWRKTGCENAPRDTCNPTSVLAGYTNLTIQPILAYTYTDNSVVQGIDYSYRVVAVFGDTTGDGFVYNEVFGLPSNEVCVYLKKDVPVITNVSVDITSVNDGKMYVAWSKPPKFINDSIVFDTVQYPGPYKYSIYRYLGFNGSPPVKFLGSYINPNFYQFNDSSFIDDSLDTKDNPYSYIVKFYSNYSNTDSVEVGTTNLASSIYLTLVGNNHIVTLTWSENVPWTNDSFFVYRQNHITKSFDLIATTKAQTYTDKGLENDTTYCYYVKSTGHYSIPDITNPLIDSSQINCTVPVDTTRPCAPMLAVYNDCNSNNNYGAFLNQLKWTLNPTACANSSILKFYIYYAPYENEPLQLIDSTKGPTDSSYISLLSNTLAGCYAVTSEDSGYIQSDKSNVVCVDNCPVYNLPNVFTPNGDEHNDLFTPILPYKFIDHINMHIFNRWGELVFETTDPAINWNGKDFKSGKDCPDGVYYYACEVYESTVAGVIKVNPPLKGYIHILR